MYLNLLLPHDLSLLKLEAYGLSKISLKLLQSYFENRKQRIKIGSSLDVIVKI